MSAARVNTAKTSNMLLSLKVKDISSSQCLQTHKMRLPQFQYIAAMFGIIIFSVLFYPDRRKIDPKSHLISFLHLLSFSSHFGAQVWMTFVAGLTIYFNVPRIWFGRVQSKLFPIFFCSAFVMASGTLATFIIQHPYDMWKSSQYIEVAALTVSLISSFINAFILSPIIVELITERFALEEGSGLAYAIGFVDLTELKKNPEYLRVHKLFRRCHGISGMVNFASLAANTIHLYYLSTQCLFV